MKKALLLVSLFFLGLSVLLAKTERLALLSEGGMELYKAEKKVISAVYMTGETLTKLSEATGEDPLDILVDIYGYENYVEVEKDAFDKRTRLYGTLLLETGTSSIPEVLKKEKKSLKSSLFLQSLAKDCGTFDRNLLDTVNKSGKKAIRIYHVEDVLEESFYDSFTIIFLKRWIKAIIG